MDVESWIATAMSVWANTIATIALILTIRQSKKKTAKVKPRKAKQKR